MPTTIEAVNLSKSFGATQAVDQINLSVSSGEIYGLVGPDGAGKTTTIRLLCGALKIDVGQVTIAGVSMNRNPEQARTHLGYLAQRFALYDDLTVLENLRFFAEVRGLSTHQWRPRSLEILEFVGLGEFKGRMAGKLSGGMKQKLGLAAGLVSSPRVLLLDEPTTGVDPVTRQDFWQLIIRLVAEEQITVLVSTPYMDEASRCMRLGFMRGGRLLLEGTPTQIRARLDGRVLELRGHPLKLLRSIAESEPLVENVQMFGDRLHLRVAASANAELAARLNQSIPAAGGTIEHLRSIPAQLEDVFISLLEGQGQA